MRVLVCGSRNCQDTDFVYGVLDRLRKGWGPDVVIIEGDYRGVDRMAGYWARRNKLTNLKFPADWKRDGYRAGPIRNARMLEEGRPDLVVAFPGGNGTRDMVTKSIQAGVPVVHIEAPPQAASRNRAAVYRGRS